MKNLFVIVCAFFKSKGKSKGKSKDFFSDDSGAGFVEGLEKGMRNALRRADGSTQAGKDILRRINKANPDKMSDLLQEMVRKGALTPRELVNMGALAGILIGNVVLAKSGALGKSAMTKKDGAATPLSDLQFQGLNRHSSRVHNPQDKE